MGVGLGMLCILFFLCSTRTALKRVRLAFPKGGTSRVLSTGKRNQFKKKTGCPICKMSDNGSFIHTIVFQLVLRCRKKCGKYSVLYESKII